MPKQPIDFSKTIIYKIVCNDLNITDIYVGHTTDFRERKYTHKSNTINPTRNRYNCKIYQTIRNNGGWDNWLMVQIENYPCNNNQEAVSRERYWFEVLNAKLNTNVPNRTDKEYYQTNKEQIKEQHKQYTDANKDKISEYQKEYQKTNKEQLKEYKREWYKNRKSVKL